MAVVRRELRGRPADEDAHLRHLVEGRQARSRLFSDYGWDLLGASVEFPGNWADGIRLSDHWLLKGSVTPTS
ncbi:hypothetical protein NKH18_02735 [Streptomyces sp. M10(2022)]